MPTETLTEAARLSVAPMMDWTDRHCRYFHRVLSRRMLLYTEMVTAPALVRGGAHHLLEHSDLEHPVALQLGGSDPDELAQAARLGEAHGYVEINLNCGCPSDRVQSGAFGAILMTTPDVVVRCVAAMRAAASVPVTVKCRIGVDDQSPEEVLPDFIERLAAAGVKRMQIHARKAWLQGLSPKENRDIPPLDYELVYGIKARHPELHLSINGGVETLDDAELHLKRGMDGVMIGRAAYHAPWDILGRADARIFDQPSPCETPLDAVAAMRPYIAAHVRDGGRVHSVTRHMLGLFAGRPGARAWRRSLSEGAARADADVGLLDEAVAAMEARAA